MRSESQSHLAVRKRIYISANCEYDLYNNCEATE